MEYLTADQMDDEKRHSTAVLRLTNASITEQKKTKKKLDQLRMRNRLDNLRFNQRTYVGGTPAKIETIHQFFSHGFQG